MLFIHFIHSSQQNLHFHSVLWSEHNSKEAQCHIFLKCQFTSSCSMEAEHTFTWAGALSMGGVGQKEAEAESCGEVSTSHPPQGKTGRRESWRPARERCVYQSSVAAVTSWHKLSGLKQHSSITTWLCRAGVQQRGWVFCLGFDKLEIKISAGHFFWRLWGKVHFQAHPAGRVLLCL